jgi:two-component system, NarL family, invasion response regulator UvrY
MTGSNILVADDHTVVRKGLIQLLREEMPNIQFGEAGSGEETLRTLRSAHWHLLILDINMPERSGVDILKHIRASHPHVKVLILSGFPEKQYALNLLRMGASGYLNKDMAPAELINAVRAVLTGRRYVSSTIAELLVSHVNQEDGAPVHNCLSDREFQILRKLAGGRGVGDIAEELHLSPKTVSTYRTRIIEKMNFRTNSDMTAYALRNNLIS